MSSTSQPPRSTYNTRTIVQQQKIVVLYAYSEWCTNWVCNATHVHGLPWVEQHTSSKKVTPSANSSTSRQYSRNFFTSFLNTSSNKRWKATAPVLLLAFPATSAFIKLPAQHTLLPWRVELATLFVNFRTCFNPHIVCNGSYLILLFRL